MAAEHWGSGTSVGERSLNRLAFQLSDSNWLKSGKKMIILTAFDKSLAQKLFLFEVSYVYQIFSEAYGISLTRYPLLIWNGNLSVLEQASHRSARALLFLTASSNQPMQTGLRPPSSALPTGVCQFESHFRWEESLINDWLLPKLRRFQPKRLPTRKCQR